ncbi:MAG: hypothetical protein DMG76_26775 [Acidobacteria bacterium]|nr:MAG: hypothetical protein DMG76_26775 [Acidobacteriota bacterium]
MTHRAFDSEPQRQQTSDLFADYNRDHDITPELDARFAALAAERIHAAPIRYYVWLPTLRIVDMWLRPRTELCPSDAGGSLTTTGAGSRSASVSA